jgi:hypothetical protein
MFTFATPFFNIGIGSGIRDPGSDIRDPRSGIRDSGIRDEQILGSGSGIKHPGSATLEGRKGMEKAELPYLVFSASLLIMQVSQLQVPANQINDSKSYSFAILQIVKTYRYRYTIPQKQRTGYR